jgi:cell filamentation protein
MGKYSCKKKDLYYKGTDIPINLLGIKDQDRLHEIEHKLLSESYLHFYDSLDTSTLFNELYFKELHNYTFRSLYNFAGIYRSHNISKGEYTFCTARHLDTSSAKIFNTLSKKNYLKNFCGDINEFAGELAWIACELNALHPFYEGNGRIIRLFIDMICFDNGFKNIDYTDVFAVKTDDENLYITASRECMTGDSNLMKNIILKGLKK